MKKTLDIYSVKKYTSSNKLEWDQFVSNAKNATFLFKRDFLEYHKDRFDDYSCLIFKDEKLYALLPANRATNIVYSHQGLTYGSLIISDKIKFNEVLEIFKCLLKFLENDGISYLNLKLFPPIYTEISSEELDYLLFLCKANLLRTEIASTINLKAPFTIQSNRKQGVKKAQKKGLYIKEITSFKPFWNEVLIPNLLEKFNANPVHSLHEIEMLANRFPKNILQFNVYWEDKIVGGTTIFDANGVAHTQYISATNNKQALGTLDYLFHYLITERFNSHRFFDLGTSNENNGLQINKGLQYWKESFGARTTTNKTYLIETKHHTLLNQVFV